MTPQETVPERIDPASGDALGQYLSFGLDGHLYAVPLARVAEILPFRELNRIPHMPEGVEGLLDHRGQVIPVISLRSRLGLESREAGRSGNIVVLNLAGGMPVGILVDAVESVVTPEPAQLFPASALLAGAGGAWVRGFILMEGKVIALLDADLITRRSTVEPSVQEGEAAVGSEQTSFHSVDR